MSKGDDVNAKTSNSKQNVDIAKRFCDAICLVLVGVVGTVVFTHTLHGQQAQANPKLSDSSYEPCYAFMRGDSLWVSCQERKESISIGKDARDFAIDPNGRFLAIQRFPHSYAKTGQNALEVVELKPPFVRKISRGSFGKLISTCGTVVSYAYHEPPIDILTMSVMRYHADAFYCSSDRNIAAEMVHESAGIKARITIHQNDKDVRSIDSISSGLFDFALSPNGKYVAYSEWRESKGLVCIAEIGGKEYCSLGPNDGAGDRASVTDEGRVLFEGTLMSTCDNSPCRSVEYWAPGMATSITLERIGDSHDPMWISPETAQALHEWNQSRSRQPQTRK